MIEFLKSFYKWIEVSLVSFLDNLTSNLKEFNAPHRREDDE